jgi:predicted enzyme related to lactoylglutathione lyase
VLENSEAFGSFSVDDVSEAGRFYGETLGLRVSEIDEPMSMLALHITGGQDVMVYAKPDHVPASFTVLNFPVEDIEEVVDGLIERGVRFERYDDTDEKGIYRGGNQPIAWFKDPAGNVLSVIQLD